MVKAKKPKKVNVLKKIPKKQVIVKSNPVLKVEKIDENQNNFNLMDYVNGFFQPGKLFEKEKSFDLKKAFLNYLIPALVLCLLVSVPLYLVNLEFQKSGIQPSIGSSTVPASPIQWPLYILTNSGSIHMHTYPVFSYFLLQDMSWALSGIQLDSLLGLLTFVVVFLFFVISSQIITLYFVSIAAKFFGGKGNFWNLFYLMSFSFPIYIFAIQILPNFFSLIPPYVFGIVGLFISAYWFYILFHAVKRTYKFNFEKTLVTVLAYPVFLVVLMLLKIIFGIRF